MAATARKPILYFIVFTVFITFYDLSNTTEHLRFYNCFMKTAGFYSDCFVEAELQRLFVVYRLKLIWTKKASPHCTRFAVTKWSKHGQTSLVISESGHLLDLTICMDIHPNPGWDRDELIPRATSTRQDGNLNFPANTHIKYSRRQLFSFKSRAAVPGNLFNLLKTQGILKSRRVRAGRLHKQRIRPISTLLGSRRTNCNYISNTNSMRSRNLHLGVNNKNSISVDLNTSSSFSSTSSATKLLKICHLNSHSINNKSTIIKDYVVETDVDVMALTETWLTPDSEFDFAIRDTTPSQYAFLHNPRINRSGGGVGLLYKSSLKVERQNQTETFKSFEYFEVILSNVTVTRIIIVYRPPQSKNNCVSNSLFFEEFPVLLEHLATASGKLIMLGDFNFHVDDTDNASAMKFLDIVNCFNLAQHITVPTHKDGHTLDLIITRNDEDLISDIDVHNH